MKTTPIILLAAALTAGSAQAQSTQKLTASKAQDYGLIYNLPLTAVDITIEAEHTQERPGEFSNYARRYLGIDNALTQPSDRVTVKSVTLTPRGVANPDNRWLVQFKNGATPYIIVDDNGALLTVNTEQPAKSSTPVLPVAQKAELTPLETEAARQAITKEMSMSSSLSKRAELASQRIFDLREMRTDLLSGQADNTPPDGRAMQLMLDNISAQEAALTAMFVGTTKKFTTVETITFMPDSIDTVGLVIARLSALDGIVDSDDLSGAPIVLNCRITERGELPVNDKGQTKSFPKGGLAYTIPGTVHITVEYDGSTVASEDVRVAQTGVTFGLDPALFTDKKAPAMLRLNSANGSIVELGTAD